MCIKFVTYKGVSEHAISCINRVFNSDIVNRLGEDLGPENACSFQSLLYYLTTGMQYLLDSAVCRVFTSEDTVVNFTAYCG